MAFAIGYALFLREDSHHLTYVTMLLPSMLVLGLGWGLAFPAMNVQATARVADSEQGLAAGLFNTSFQIGGAILVAIVSAVISSHTTAVGGGEAQGILASMRPTLAILTASALAGVVLLVGLLRLGCSVKARCMRIYRRAQPRGADQQRLPPSTGRSRPSAAFTRDAV